MLLEKPIMPSRVNGSFRPRGAGGAKQYRRDGANRGERPQHLEKRVAVGTVEAGFELSPGENGIHEGDGTEFLLELDDDAPEDADSVCSPSLLFFAASRGMHMDAFGIDDAGRDAAGLVVRRDRLDQQQLPPEEASSAVTGVA